MIESSEKAKEKINNKTKKNEIVEIQRNEEKKSTLSLSETPNIINEITQYYNQSKYENFSNLQMNEYSYLNGILDKQKLKQSFMNEPISHNKEESRSSLEEIQMLIKSSINQNKNKSKGKKETKQKNNSKKKSSFKNKDELIFKSGLEKKNHSSKKKNINYLLSEEEQKAEKKKKKKIKIKKVRYYENL